MHVVCHLILHYFVSFWSNHGQVGDNGSGGREDGHTTTSSGKQEAEQRIPDLLMEGEQMQLEEEQPEVCIVYMAIVRIRQSRHEPRAPGEEACQEPLDRMVMSYKHCIAWHQMRTVRVLW